jgi:integrase
MGNIGRMSRSTYGEGSVWFNEQRGLWFGQVFLGPGQRPRVSAKNKGDMLAKMRKLYEAKPERSEGLSVADWLDHWTGTILPRRVEGGTLTNYRNWSSWYLKPHLGPIGLEQLSTDDVEAMLTALEEQGLSANTVRSALGLLRRGLRAAKRRGKVTTNVAEDVEGPRIPRAQISDRLDAEEAQAVLKVLLYDRLYPLALTALYLGTRPGELYALTWDRLDLRRKTLRVIDAKTPSGYRTIPLPPPVVKALRAHRRASRPTGLVFTDENGEALKARNVLRWWHDATIRAGVGRRRFYCTRHTAATLMLNNGVALEVVSAILGHAGLSITADIYAEVGPQLQADALDKMSEVLSF